MKPFAQQTYYEILEVPPTATDAEIRAAHQRLMELYSPDSVAVYALGDPEQVDALRERMNEAMEMLTDADLRVEYDRSIGLSTERLTKAAVTAGAADKVDSATRVAEALATAAAALAKAAGAVDAERLEAESRLKAAASVNEQDAEAPRESGTPGKSEERMRGEESKRQEGLGKEAQGAASGPVMVGGMAVVEAFRASFTQSLSFVYVPAVPPRAQGRAAEAEAPVPPERPSVTPAASAEPVAEAKSAPVASAPESVVLASEARAAKVSPETVPTPAAAVSEAKPVAVASAPESGSVHGAPVAVPAPVATAETASVVAAPAPVVTVPAPVVTAEAASVVAAPAPVVTGGAATPVAHEAADAHVASEAVSAPVVTAEAASVVPVPAPVVTGASATPVAHEAAAQVASEAVPAPVVGASASVASSEPSRPAETSATTPPLATQDAAASPTPVAESGTVAPGSSDAGSQPVATSPVPTPDAPATAPVTTTQGESDPHPTSSPALDASSTALVRAPATGATRPAVRPLTATRPSGSTPAVKGPKGPVVRKLGDAQVLSQDSAIATAESALAQVAARVREARPRGVDIPADAEFNGELLRRVREARGLTIQQLADRTRISVRHLENVEADRYTALPTTVYLRGILMNLARELGLDPLRVSKSYLALFSEKPAKSGR
jgi:curved DNA-binding protein CbpA